MQNVAHDPIVELVESGRDVRIEGSAASVRLGEVASRLSDEFNVLQLAAPEGGLSLSALIALLSGRSRFDDQDDSALEAGFRRLSGADAPELRTVLLLDATEGVQRPVFRYLQQVGRSAPQLQFVIASTPEVSALLDSPDMGRLRERLTTVVLAGEPLAPAPARSLTVVPNSALAALVQADWTLEASRRAALRERRRTRRVALMWTTSGAALVASAVLGVWLGQSSMAHSDARPVASTPPAAVAAAEPDRRPDLKLPLVPANVAAPPLAWTAMPSPLAATVAPAPATIGGVPSPATVAGVPSPATVAGVPTQTGGAASPAPALAGPTTPEAVVAGEPPAAVPAKPEPVVVASEERASPAPESAQGEPRQAEPRQAETRPAETRPAETRPAEARQAETRPADTRPAEPRVAAAPTHSRTVDLRRPMRQRVAGTRPRLPPAAGHFAEDDRPLPNYGVEALPEEPVGEPAPPRRRRGRAVREPSGADADLPSREAMRPTIEVPPYGARYVPHADNSFAVPYASGPYGARTFRYDP